jgi:hypothetical protein
MTVGSWTTAFNSIANIQRPSGFQTFRRHLLRPKQIVKLVFRIALRDDAGVETEEVERMWVIIERRLGLGRYEGLT